MKSFWTITALCIISATNLQAQESTAQEQEIEREIQKANELYKQQQYQQAETAYNEVLKKDPDNSTAKYNRALALQKQGKSGEAIKVFNDVAFKTDDHQLKSKAYYNKGAILSGQQNLEESIEAYKNALRQNPDDKEARENLQKALLELKKKTPKKNDKQNKQQQKQQQKPQPRMNQKEAEQRLKLLEQKEREVQERLQKEKSKSGGGQPKDW
ncbi:tetratricopeptide repeat protein [Terrimonas pollutisoli]|uniref:tetratricopeptide repeat protein n=1 Tax=Terrimonas pollutisoli TaxID=3034147 RepID=UPI0023EDC6A9|nr:tetratricopeptide repeat protein [Terrimonas sp. H1YJ31]